MDARRYSASGTLPDGSILAIRAQRPEDRTGIRSAVRHVALVAVAKGVIVGGCRYIVGEPGVGEVAFAVAEDWQGRGLGHLLMQHLSTVARQQGLRRFVADVPRDNTAMLGVFRGAGLPVAMHYELGTVHVTVDLTPAFSDSGASHHA